MWQFRRPRAWNSGNGKANVGASIGGQHLPGDVRTAAVLLGPGGSEPAHQHAGCFPFVEKPKSSASPQPGGENTFEAIHVHERSSSPKGLVAHTHAAPPKTTPKWSSVGTCPQARFKSPTGIPLQTGATRTDTVAPESSRPEAIHDHLGGETVGTRVGEFPPPGRRPKITR